MPSYSYMIVVSQLPPLSLHLIDLMICVNSPPVLFLFSLELKEACTALQLCAASLRRAVADMTKLKKGLEKVRKQAAAAKAKAEKSGAHDPAASRALAGRTNFSKSVTASDPMVLQTFKVCTAKRAIRIVKDAGELVNGTADSSIPFAMKKGRTLSKQLVKDASLRGNLDATLQEFCKKVESGPDSKSVILGGKPP